MKCPYCGREMRAGYIQAPGRRVFFGETLRRNGLYFKLRKGDIKISKSVMAWYNDAAFCEDCGCCITFVSEKRQEKQTNQ